MSKHIVWLAGEIKSPPFSRWARIETGHLLRLLQEGVRLKMPESRPMPSIGTRCHELRVVDRDRTWRIVYRIDRDAILRLDVFAKTGRRTPMRVLENCKRRARSYDMITKGV